MKRFDERLLDEIRDRITLSDVVGRKVELKRAGREWRGISPFNAEKSPSFYVNDQKQFYHCFSSGQHGNIFTWLTRIEGLSFGEAVERAGEIAGVDVPKSGPPRQRSPAEIQRAADEDAEMRRRRARKDQERIKDEARRVDAASSIWKATQPLPGTLGARYFEARGIDPAGLSTGVLRFHPALPHPEADANFPTVVAKAVDIEGRGRGVWRIFLRADGRDKAFPKGHKFNPKLGKGIAHGCCVRLGGMGDTIGVCEGVETGEGIREMFDYRFPVWSLLSTSGFRNFVPPSSVRKIYVFEDGDLWRERKDGTWSAPPGRSAGDALIERLRNDFDLQRMPAPEHGDFLDALAKEKMRKTHERKFAE